MGSEQMSKKCAPLRKRISGDRPTLGSSLRGPWSSVPIVPGIIVRTVAVVQFLLCGLLMLFKINQYN